MAFDRHGECFVLLGREAYGFSKGKWSTFGGGLQTSTEPLDVAAAREAHEESGGLLGTAAHLHAAIIRDARRLDVPSGAHFILPIQHVHQLPDMFAGARACLSSVKHGYSPFLEKDALTWVPLATLPTFADVRPDFASDFGVLLPVLEELTGIVRKSVGC